MGVAIDLKWAMGCGYSQGARFLRQFMHDGFNQDEKRRKVFDSLFAAAAGSVGRCRWQ